LTPTNSATQTLTRTPSLTPTQTATRTPSRTRTLTPTRTPTPPQAGPRIGFFGVYRFDGCQLGCSNANCCGITPTPTPEFLNGVQVFTVTDPRGGLIVVEAFKRPGPNPDVGTTLIPQGGAPPADRPDLWIQANKAMGNGNPLVCGPPGDGIPAVPTPNFDESDGTITNALRDFACRFVVQVPSTACTRDTFGNPSVVNSSTERQFCDSVNTDSRFPVGDTLLTVVVRDDPPPAGPGGAFPNLGPTAQMIIRVLPSPTPAF
jgi:hypothetical protein